MSNQKKHARDFLKELISENEETMPVWIRQLILKVIENDWIISESEKDGFLREILKTIWIEENEVFDFTSTESPVTYSSNQAQDKKKRKIILKALTHVKWVNALLPQQTIQFSKNCTILYGLNGSWKSGYFKTINEIAWWMVKKEVLWNIYKAWLGEKEISIDYLADDTLVSYWWQFGNKLGEMQRWFLPEVQVFDSEYLDKFLKARKNWIDPQPLWLHYFTVITGIMGDFSQFLESTINALNKPDIIGILSQIKTVDFKNLINIWKIPDKWDYEKLAKFEFFSAENEKELLEKETQLWKIAGVALHTELNKKNIWELEFYIKTLRQTEIFFKIKIWKLHWAILEYKKAKSLHEEMQKKLDILKTIPQDWILSWEEFIKSGAEYKKECELKHKDINENTCPYCHQELATHESQVLLNTYQNYLEDKTTTRLDKAKKILNLTKKDIEWFKLWALLNIPDSERIKEEDPLLLKMLEWFNEKFHTSQTTVLLNYTQEKSGIKSIIWVSHNVYGYFNRKMASIKEKQSQLQKDISQKDILEKRVFSLKDSKLFSISYATIMGHYDFLVKKNKYEIALRQAKNTTLISRKWGEASSQLALWDMNVILQQELWKLHTGFKISLEKVSNSWGQIETLPKIVIQNTAGWIDAKKILSEWEQKALWLSILLTEIIVQDIPCVVFDDPVNSLDDKIIWKFSDRIIELSKMRQIVIFTHNKYFQKTLEESIKNIWWFHVCWNINSCTKNDEFHAYSYHILKDWNSESWKIIERWADNLNTFLRDAQRKISSTNNESIFSIASDLKMCIECFIDEIILQGNGALSSRNKDENIYWDKLWKINSDKNTIDTLRAYWRELSNRGTHSTNNSENNPLTLPELQDIVNFLKDKSK